MRHCPELAVAEVCLDFSDSESDFEGDALMPPIGGARRTRRAPPRIGPTSNPSSFDFSASVNHHRRHLRFSRPQRRPPLIPPSPTVGRNRLRPPPAPGAAAASPWRPALLKPQPLPVLRHPRPSL
jgi:hypothetical protein